MLDAEVPLWRELPPDQQQTLLERIGPFISGRRWEGIGVEIDDAYIHAQLAGEGGWRFFHPYYRPWTDPHAPIDLMAEIHVPLLVIHGTTDSIIPMRLGKAIYTACPSVDKTWCEVTDAGHNNLSLQHPKVESALRTFAEAHAYE